MLYTDKIETIVLETLIVEHVNILDRLYTAKIIRCC